MTYNFDYNAIANEIVYRNINMFDGYDEWTRGAFALSCIPDGRDIFHAISSLSPKYTWRENEYKFNNAMKTNSRITIATFLRMANDNGINLADYRSDGKWAEALSGSATPLWKSWGGELLYCKCE